MYPHFGLREIRDDDLDFIKGGFLPLVPPAAKYVAAFVGGYLVADQAFKVAVELSEFAKNLLK